MDDVGFVVQISTNLNSWVELETEIDDSSAEGTHDLLTPGLTIDTAPGTSRFVRIRINQGE